MWHDYGVLGTLLILIRLANDLIGWSGLLFSSRSRLQAEILFLRRQLALYAERGVKPLRVDAASRVTPDPFVAPI